MIRYRTRDLTRLLPGTARSMRRMEKVTGRTDDMIILRGVNLFPTQIEELILRVPGLSPHFQLVLPRPHRLDELTVRVEARPATAGADERAAQRSRARRPRQGLDRRQRRRRRDRARSRRAFGRQGAAHRSIFATRPRLRACRCTSPSGRRVAPDSRPRRSTPSGVVRAARTRAVQNPDRVRLEIADGLFAAMPAADAELGYAGLKTYAWTGSGTPFLVVLVSIEETRIEALIEADYLGRLRTGSRHGGRGDAARAPGRGDPRA